MVKNQNELQLKAKNLPNRPGCYLMYRKDKEVLYVGKAKDLKKRVSSYFSNSVKSSKTEFMLSHVIDFNFMITETEAEAFILENNLIKKHAPKYNIRMRDDKSYPYIVVNKKEKFPRLLYKRKVRKNKDSKIYGPFAEGSQLSDVLRILIKSFKLRDCTQREFNSRKEPCLLYQINQCSAPCVNYIIHDDYNKDLELALNFFEGKGERSIEYLENKMIEASEKEFFEEAAIMRDSIDLLKDFNQKSVQKNAEWADNQNVDIIAYHEGEIEVDICIYLVRKGLLLGSKVFHFPVDYCQEETQKEVIKYLFQYYQDLPEGIPELIVHDFKKLNESLFEEGLNNISKVKLRTPGRKFKSIFDLVKSRANEASRMRTLQKNSFVLALDKLKELVSLKERPRIIECYDIAIFQGTSPTAAQIVFVDGKPAKDAYRHYKLQERPEGNNDFAMMEEVLSRRIKYGKLPDIFVVDGGKGQITSFQKVLEENKINIPVIGLAKSKSKSNFKKSKVVMSEERLLIPNRLNPYILNKNKMLLKMMVHMRDEAHRFSRRLHHKGESKRVISSWLDEIEGIGPKTKDKILSRPEFKKLEIFKMNVNQLMKNFDLKRSLASKIFHFTSTNLERE